MEINISGAGLLKEDERTLIVSLVEKTLGKHQHVGAIDVKISAHNSDGERKKYVVNLVAKTSNGFYNAESFDWKLNLAVKDALSKIDKTMHKKR